MGIPAAPRIDPRLRQHIAGAPFLASPAEVTRSTGMLAWQLGLTRPSYQQVRVLMGGAIAPRPVKAAAQTSKGKVVLRGIGAAYDFMAQYPGPGLEDWYRRYKRGGA